MQCGGCPREYRGALGDRQYIASDRSPASLAFQLTADEWNRLRSRIVTSKSGPRGGTRYAPMAFTEQGVAMLSSVLRSKRAIQVNVEIIRTFVRLRSLLASHAELSQRLDDLECRYDDQFRCVFDAIRDLMEPPDPPRKRIGFQ